MFQYTISVTLNGINYLTNVIVDKHATEEEILQLAKEQVEKQWLH
ncbi:BA3454 family stress response protein [Neobacillus sp. D3-1R]